MSTSTPKNKKLWPFPTDLTNEEQRTFLVAMAGSPNPRNYNTLLVEFEQMKGETEEARIRKGVDILLDPFVHPALILVAAKREQPATSLGEVLAHLDAGEWSIDFEAMKADADDNADDAAGEVVPDPLPLPSPPNET